MAHLKKTWAHFLNGVIYEELLFRGTEYNCLAYMAAVQKID